MSVRVISTRIALEGEAEYKEQMGAVNRELRNLRSELKYSEEQFHGQADSMEALEAKGRILRDSYAQQEEKVRALEKAVEDSTAAYGESAKKTDDYRRQLLDARTALERMGREVRENEQYLDEARKSTDKTATSIDKFGREVKDAGEDADRAGRDFEALAGELKGLKDMMVGGAIAAGFQNLAGSILDVEESTREYRSIMGSLEVSSQSAGYTAEQTAAVYDHLYGVLGDTQAAATTVANLQAIGLSQEDLITVTNAAIGAWATYGDSIPIDGLAEAINETVQAGQVTGTFADVLNWAGVSEDDFNTKLEAASDSTERANLVLQQLTGQGLTDAAEAWVELNEDIYTTNQTQAELDAAWAKLGETLSPVADFLRTTLTNGILAVSDALEDMIAWVQKAINWLGQLSVEPMERAQEIMAADRIPTRGTLSGSHAAGLDRVPFDGYVAELHRDEAVLTAQEAEVWRALSSRIPPTTTGVSVQQLQSTVASAVNGLSSVMSSGGTKRVYVVKLVVNGREFYQTTLDDLRAVERATPEVRDDT